MPTYQQASARVRKDFHVADVCLYLSRRRKRHEAGPRDQAAEESKACRRGGGDQYPDSSKCAAWWTARCVRVRVESRGLMHEHWRVTLLSQIRRRHFSPVSLITAKRPIRCNRKWLKYNTLVLHHANPPRPLHHLVLSIPVGALITRSIGDVASAINRTEKCNRTPAFYRVRISLRARLRFDSASHCRVCTQPFEPPAVT